MRKIGEVVSVVGRNGVNREKAGRRKRQLKQEVASKKKKKKRDFKRHT